MTLTRAIGHPTDDDLRAYAQGRLSVEDASELEPHLETCEECGAKLAGTGSDTLCDLLRMPTTKFQTIPFSTSGDSDLPGELRNHSRYDIQERLGRGGMGVVYRAVHRMMHRPVALKVIRPELLAAPEAVERFRREVRAAAKLAHPNIVAAYDAEEVAGMHFLVMEYVNGQTLEAIVRKRGPLPVSAACHLARQVALGLEHAHAHGMVHRDIKPLNLILADKSKVKILDFGLALLHDPHDALEPSTKEGQALGTLLYAAPEQRHSAGRVDARADLYSLGATLAFLLTGVPPSKKDWPETIPAGVQEILHRLLAKNPEDRYPSAKAAAEALTPWCSRKAPAVEANGLSRRAVLVGGLGAVALATGVGFWLSTRKSETPTASASAVPPPPAPEWHSLLPVIDPRVHAVAGYWKRLDGELTSNAAIGARIVVPVIAPAEYDLRVEFTRKTGEWSIGAIVCKGGRQFTFELDAWEQHLAGFQNLAGQSLMQQEPRRFFPLTNGKRYQFLVEVRRDSVAGFLDGREIVRHATDGKDLGIDERYWAIPNKKVLGLLAWNSETSFHAVDMRIVSFSK